jgi:peptidoglycan/LPS O-acetylase OafA/YrhL
VPASRFLGKISYTVYVLHIPCLYVAKGAYAKLINVNSSAMNAIALSVFSVTLAVVAYSVEQYFDEPIRRKLRVLRLENATRDRLGKA